MKKNGLKPSFTRPEDVPVTQRMLFLVRDELKTTIQGSDSKLSGRIDSVDLRLESLNTKIEGVDNKLSVRIDELDNRLSARIDELDNRITTQIKELDIKLSTQIKTVEANLSSQIIHLGVLIEEQNARNTVVLDCLTSFIQRQDRFDDELTHLTKVISGVKGT